MNPWRGLGGLPPAMWLLAGATLINRLGTMFMPFLVLYLTRQLGLDAARAGLTMSLYGAGALAMAPLGGRLVDRFGAQRMLEGSLFLSGALLIAFPLARSFPAVASLVVLIAIATEPGRSASLTLVPLLVGLERHKPAFALNRLASNLGISIGPALGSLLVARPSPSSFHVLFAVDGATSIAAALVLGLAAMRPAPVASPPAAAREAPSNPGGGAATARPGWRDAALLHALAVSLAVGLVFFQLESTLAIYLTRDLRLPASVYGLVFTVNTVLIVLLELPLNSATALWPHAHTLALGSLFVGAGFGALPLVRGATGALSTVVLWTFGEMLFFPSMSAHVAALAPAARRGEYMGLYTMSFGLAFALGPLVGMAVLGRFGGTVLFTAAAVLALGGALASLRLRPAGR